MLDVLSDAARVWFFPLTRDLAPDEAGALVERVRAWAATWASHGRPVRSAVAIAEGRVLVVGAEISAEELNAGVSGCGIDAMTHAVEAALADAGLAVAGALDVVAQGADGAWHAMPRPAFRALVREGAAGTDTTVLDLTPTTLGEVRARGLARPAGEAWHARAFRLGTPA